VKATEMADLFHARHTGEGSWMAKCPAHEDRSPSLSIREGGDGRVLVKCFAGCELTVVLKALGLTIRDLFDGEPVTPKQRALLVQERETKAAQQQERRQADRQMRDRLRKLEVIVNALGGKLMRSPQDEELARLFHVACDKLHEQEARYERASGEGFRNVYTKGTTWVG
jgi:hypothetical protein